MFYSPYFWRDTIFHFHLTNDHNIVLFDISDTGTTTIGGPYDTDDGTPTLLQIEAAGTGTSGWHHSAQIQNMLVTNDGSIVLCNDDDSVVGESSIGKALQQPTYNIEVVEIMQSNFAPTNDITKSQHQQTIHTTQPMTIDIDVRKTIMKKRPAHMQPKQNETQRHVCPRCGKDYSQSKNMRRHYRLECGQEPRFPCPFCKLRYKRNNQLKNHLITRHCVKINNGNAYLPMQM